MRLGVTITALFLCVAVPALPGGKKPPGSSSSSYPKPYIEAGGLSISKEGYNLIIKHETGGASYYNRYLRRITYPGGGSGLTGGIGYDFGWTPPSRIQSDWEGLLAQSVIDRLKAASGKKGAAARRLAPSYRSVVIPWDIALKVYNKKTIPRFARLTKNAYPGIETLHPHLQSTRLSWTFNRGSGIHPTKPRDREKRALRADTPSRPTRFPSHYRASKWIWVGKGLDGLLRRREDEASLDEEGLRQMGLIK